MTISEFIQLLSQFPPELPLVVPREGKYLSVKTVVMIPESNEAAIITE